MSLVLPKPALEPALLGYKSQLYLMDQEVLDLRPGKYLYPAQNLKDPLNVILTENMTNI